MKHKVDIHNVTMISEGTTIEGSIISNGSIRIDGKVFGNIEAAGMVTQGHNSEIKGDVKADSFIVGGVFSGTINCTGKVSIEGKSRVTGDLLARSLVVEEGAVFNGKSSMPTPE